MLKISQLFIYPVKSLAGISVPLRNRYGSGIGTRQAVDAG